eukprot:m.187955 g.187955  ORF g.187955 m.187955 type:complete len:499 (+) comp13627_c0_seq21:1985-3481(+)
MGRYCVLTMNVHNVRIWNRPCSPLSLVSDVQHRIIPVVYLLAWVHWNKNYLYALIISMITHMEITSDVWKCYDCVAGVKCINGDVVWLKLGNHRYWPALSVEDSSLPLAVQQRKPKGESLSFCVKFFGTGDYTWTSHMRVIKWSLNDEKGYFAKTGKQKPSFLQALKDAAVAYNTVKADREQLMVALRGRVDTKPPLFQRLRTNMYTIPRMRLDVAEECGCVEECDDNCLNKLLSVECDPKKCTTGDKCSNRRIQQRKYPKLVPFLTPNRGWGLKAGEDIAQGRFVIEYVGEVIGEEECKRRLAENEKNKNHSFYILSLCRGVYVDARLKANLARFINHSCDPNCSIQKWNVLGEIKVGIFAKMDIKKGTELTFDYQLLPKNQWVLQLCFRTSSRALACYIKALWTNVVQCVYVCMWFHITSTPHCSTHVYPHNVGFPWKCKQDSVSLWWGQLSRVYPEIIWWWKEAEERCQRQVNHEETKEGEETKDCERKERTEAG